MPARGAGDSVFRDMRLSPAPRALVFSIHGPGVPLRSTPGFMLSPAPQAGFDFVAARLFVQSQAIAYRTEGGKAAYALDSTQSRHFELRTAAS